MILLARARGANCSAVGQARVGGWHLIHGGAHVVVTQGRVMKEFFGRDGSRVRGALPSATYGLC